MFKQFIKRLNQPRPDPEVCEDPHPDSMGLLGRDAANPSDYIKVPKDGPLEPVNLFELYGSTVRDQGRTNRCTGFAGAAGVELLSNKLAAKAGADWRNRFSANELYWHTRFIKDRDDGGFMSELMRSMHRHGAVDERFWTDSDSLFHRPKSLDLAPNFKLHSYYRIPIKRDETVESCQRVLSVERLPIWIGMAMHDLETRRAGHGDLYRIPSDRDRNTGGHAMLVVGWEFYRGEPVFTIQNSWGTRWGRGGLFRIDARLFQEWNHVFDLWTAGDEYY